MLGQDQASIDLTMKTYGVKDGLATRIHQKAIEVMESKLGTVHPTQNNNVRGD